jgi:hypothetical protein
MCQQQYGQTHRQTCTGRDLRRGEDDRDRDGDVHAHPRANEAGAGIVPDDEPTTASEPRDRHTELTWNG